MTARLDVGLTLKIDLIWFIDWLSDWLIDVVNKNWNLGGTWRSDVGGRVIVVCSWTSWLCRYRVIQFGHVQCCRDWTTVTWISILYPVPHRSFVAAKPPLPLARDRIVVVLQRLYSTHDVALKYAVVHSLYLPRRAQSAVVSVSAQFWTLQCVRKIRDQNIFL